MFIRLLVPVLQRQSLRGAETAGSWRPPRGAPPDRGAYASACSG